MNHPTSAVATTMMRELRNEVRQHLRSGRVILAVDGTPGAGQARFADALGDAFAEDGTTVVRASASAFDGATGEPVVDEVRRQLIEPFRTSAHGGFTLAPAEEATTAPADAVLIVDGVFLLSPELRGLWNWSVWLDVHPTSAFARLSEEDGTDPDPDAESNAALRAAISAYIRASNPKHAASALIENTDPDNPVRIFGDFC